MDSISRQLLMSSGTGAPGLQKAYTTPGTYTWVAPADVTSVCVVCVGGGSSTTGNSFNTGGYGGGLGYKNNISVTPGASYTVVVGDVGGDSYFIDTYTCLGGGGTSNEPGGYVGDGGGAGGSPGALGRGYAGGGGGGAGGYSGAGGNGGSGSESSYSHFNGSNGSGGGGGGGGGGSDRAYSGLGYNIGGGGGGGVGILGQGASGAGGQGKFGERGYSGSGGTDGTQGGQRGAFYTKGGNGGLYGGGGGVVKWEQYPTKIVDGSVAGHGAVRIIWGAGRSFPSTLTGDL